MAYTPILEYQNNHKAAVSASSIAVPSSFTRGSASGSSSVVDTVRPAEGRGLRTILLNMPMQDESHRSDRVDPDATFQPPGIATDDHLGRAFLAVATAAASRPALQDASGTVSYRTLQAAARSIAEQLTACDDFVPGDRVVLRLSNGVEYIAAFYGVLLAGGIVVPVPPDIERGRFRRVTSICGARLVLTSKAARRRTGSDGDDSFESWTPNLRTSPARSDHAALGGGDATAAIFFTSGSTGDPKGVTLSHANLLSNAASIIEYLAITPADRALGLLPFYHAFGNSVLQTHLLRGAAIVIGGSPLFPETILDTIRTFGVTSLSGVPDVFRSLLSRSSLGEIPTPSLKTIAIAGGRLDPDQTQVLACRVAPAEVFVMYGQTEATARLAWLPPHCLDERFGSIGRAIPGVELQVRDELGRPAAVGQVGELWARGPNVMRGYWGDPEATAAVLQNGWLRTGDLATVDRDGFIYPQGRRNGLVKIAGHRVHPAELEQFVRREVQVLEAAAVPYDSPDGSTRLALFVQPWNRDCTLTAEIVRQECAGGLPRHLVPEYIEIVNRLPLNDAFKIDRPALRRRAETVATPKELCR